MPCNNTLLLTELTGFASKISVYIPLAVSNSSTDSGELKKCWASEHFLVSKKKFINDQNSFQHENSICQTTLN